MHINKIMGLVLAAAAIGAKADCDQKTVEAAQKKWSELTGIPVAELPVVGTEVFHQFQDSPQGAWGKALLVSFEKANGPKGTVLARAGGDSPRECKVKSAVLERAENIVNFPKQDVIVLVEDFFVHDIRSGTSGRGQAPCAVQFGLKKFQHREYSKAEELKNEPNFFHVSLNVRGLNTQSFRFNPKDKNEKILLKSFEDDKVLEVAIGRSAEGEDPETGQPTGETIEWNETMKLSTEDSMRPIDVEIAEHMLLKCRVN